MPHHCYSITFCSPARTCAYTYTHCIDAIHAHGLIHVCARAGPFRVWRPLRTGQAGGAKGGGSHGVLLDQLRLELAPQQRHWSALAILAKSLCQTASMGGVLAVNGCGYHRSLVPVCLAHMLTLGASESNICSLVPAAYDPTGLSTYCIQHHGRGCTHRHGADRRTDARSMQIVEEDFDKKKTF